MNTDTTSVTTGVPSSASTLLRTTLRAEPGGTLEPQDLVRAYRNLAKQAPAHLGESFEIVDAQGKLQAEAVTPFSIGREAERLGVERYQQVAMDGTRTVFAKDGASWKREPGLAPTVPERVERAVHPYEAKLAQRYVIGPDRPASLDAPSGQFEYRPRGDESRVAFSSDGLAVWSQNNDRDAIKSMVELAAGRQWDPLAISGHPEFVRTAWLEASLAGLRTRGYQPTKADLEVLDRERGATPRPSLSRQPDRQTTPVTASRAIERRPEAQRAVLSAIEAVLVSRRVPEPTRQAVMHAASEKLAEGTRHGVVHRVRVFDRAAAPQASRTVGMPTVATPTVVISAVASVREQATPVR